MKAAVDRLSLESTQPGACSAALDSPVERIVVFRALMLGDLLCATPALRALRQGFPRAEITLVGLPWAREFAQRLPWLDRFIDFPGWPGLPEVPCDVATLPDFLAQVQSHHFDLALQLHGSGRIVNSLVGAFGARQMAGFHDDNAWRPEADAALFARWPEEGHEIVRLLGLTRHLGLADAGVQMDFPLLQADREALAACWPDAFGDKPFVCVHAGSQLPSRRWPLDRFAAVADALADQGFTVVLTGGGPELPLVNALEAAMRRAAVNLAGRTSLWTMGALIERAARVISNDTGVSHIAAALHRDSVVISNGSDALRWAPLDTSRHRVLWQAMDCRPCSHAVCPVNNACAKAVEVDAVLAAVGTNANANPNPNAATAGAVGALVA